MPKIKKEPVLRLGKPIYFYDKSVELRFCDDRDGKSVHEYYRKSPTGWLPVTGVTTACGVLDKSLYLMPWACKAMEQKILQLCPVDESGRIKLQIEQFADLLRECKTAHKDILVDAGNVGSAAHYWIEVSIQKAIEENGGFVETLTDPPSDDKRVLQCGKAALDWMTQHSVRFLQTERKIYSKEYDYAGTMDGLALVDSCHNGACCAKIFVDELSVIDWKSSNHLRVEYLYQTAAYEQAEREESGAPIQSRWILRLGKEDGKFESWYATEFEKDFRTFLCCLNLLRTHRESEERVAETKKAKTARKKRMKESGY
jgi:hypothetical protein